MMPSAQPITMISPAAAKPKIGFSIDSIVGDRFKSSNVEEDSNEALHENLPQLPTSPTDLRREYSHLMKRARQQMTPSPQNIDGDNRTNTRLSESSDQDFHNNNNNRSKQRSPSPQSQNQKGPLMVPGIPAGFMNRPQMIPHGHQLPPYHDIQPGHPHFLQFQAAAALVHAQASQSGFHGGMQHHLPHLHNHSIPRDSYQLYPWLLSRHGRIFPHRFPGSE